MIYMRYVSDEEPLIPSSGSGEGRIELNGKFLPDPLRGPGSVPGHQSQAAPVGDDDWPRMELVLDGNNLLPFHFLRTGDRMGRAVVKIQRDDGASGTGFLVAPDVLLTNHHVLPCAAIAATSVALANFEVSPSDHPSGRPSVSPLDPDSLFVTDAELDFTFCGVNGLAYLGSIPLDRERMDVASGETVTIIQHPRGRPKEVALRDNRVVSANGVVVRYSCDTEPGSSGSPVFNYQWKPVAIHHASVLTDGPEGRRIAADSHSRYLNEGIRLSAIALRLQTTDAATPEVRDQVGRLRALFEGLDPNLTIDPAAPPLRPAPSPDAARTSDSLDALIERKIRDALTPVVAEMIATVGVARPAADLPPLAPVEAALARVKTPSSRRKSRRSR